MASDTVSKQVESIFKEMSVLVAKKGYSGAIAHLLSATRHDRMATEDIHLYEYIIKTVSDSFSIRSSQLFEDKRKFFATDARRAAYVLIMKYLSYSRANIALQFKRSRGLISQEMDKHEQQIKDSGNIKTYGEYKQRFDQADKVIELFIAESKKEEKQIRKAR